MTDKKPLLTIACGALVQEILEIKRANDLDHLDVTCVPAIYHNHPEKIAPAVQRLITQHRGDYERFFIAFADCGTQGELAKICAAPNVSMIDGPHCYAFYEGLHRFSKRDEIDCFYLTDFLVRHFENFIWTPLGLDKHPELLSMYFAHYKTLVYQAQTHDFELTAKAKTYATRLGLAFQRRYTGYGELERDLLHHAKSQLQDFK